MIVKSLIESSYNLSQDLQPLSKILLEEGFIEYVYNPLIYAWEPHKAFIELGGNKGAKTILLGMNPGPHGMGQMGIPFAATSIVRDFLKIKNLPVLQPERIHPKRIIKGLDWQKEEISGTRLWSALFDNYGSVEKIFSKIFVVNHCPLMFFRGVNGTNITPDKIPGETIKKIIQRCDVYLKEIVDIMQIETVVGVGKYSKKRAEIALEETKINLKSCWHPSPASPLANKNKGADWRENFKSILPE
ncbi:MAG: uracil-DNA glycosylase family protein [Candidatus Thalassarchaeaceae archaeon]|jgi:single-strand selective monofunctional uracil DNA glycosylase